MSIVCLQKWSCITKDSIYKPEKIKKLNVKVDQEHSLTIGEVSRRRMAARPIPEGMMIFCLFMA